MSPVLPCRSTADCYSPDDGRDSGEGRRTNAALLWTDYARGLAEFWSLSWTWPALARAPRGDGHPVLVLPGLAVSDLPTVVLRRFLPRLGYRTYGWARTWARRRRSSTQLRARMKAGRAWQGNDLIFCQDDGRPWNPDHVSKRFKKLAAQAGVPVIKLHEGGRHTGNSLMRDAGADQEIRMREVGHADRDINDRYTHVLIEAHLGRRRADGGTGSRGRRHVMRTDVVSKQPPWSMAMSATTDPGRMPFDHLTGDELRRALRVSVGCVTFPPCRGRSRTHSVERMMPAGASASPRSGRYLV